MADITESRSLSSVVASGDEVSNGYSVSRINKSFCESGSPSQRIRIQRKNTIRPRRYGSESSVSSCNSCNRKVLR